jgi:hypothetical protein
VEAISRGEGCSIALIGCAIAVIAVGLGAWGFAGALTLEHYEDATPAFALAIVGGIVGLIVSIVGVVKAVSGTEDQCEVHQAAHQAKTSAVYVPPGKHLCPYCGCWVADGSKTCEYCGTEVK